MDDACRTCRGNLSSKGRRTGYGQYLPVPGGVGKHGQDTGPRERRAADHGAWSRLVRAGTRRLWDTILYNRGADTSPRRGYRDNQEAVDREASQLQGQVLQNQGRLLRAETPAKALASNPDWRRGREADPASSRQARGYLEHVWLTGSIPPEDRN